jgi:hypothetical protein
LPARTKRDGRDQRGARPSGPARRNCSKLRTAIRVAVRPATAPRDRNARVRTHRRPSVRSIGSPASPPTTTRPVVSKGACGYYWPTMCIEDQVDSERDDRAAALITKTQVLRHVGHELRFEASIVRQRAAALAAKARRLRPYNAITGAQAPVAASGVPKAGSPADRAASVPLSRDVSPLETPLRPMSKRLRVDRYSGA